MPESNPSSTPALALLPVLCLLVVAPRSSQAACQPAAGMQRGDSSVVRSIEDPALGKSWGLLKDCAHPGGPGRLVALAPPTAGAAKAGQGNATVAVAKREPVEIHAGETIALVEETSVVHLALQAIALESGAKGTRIKVRLVGGGSVLTAAVLGPGQAGLIPGIEPFAKTNEVLP
ncbi:MAG TPA: flagella basal body P-ring formation protein FlgA [Acidisarcina sp.]|nr:flagella basal body P-ring formation protein FlgA [Acidisarcina sp.]